MPTSPHDPTFKLVERRKRPRGPLPETTLMDLVKPPVPPPEDRSIDACFARFCAEHPEVEQMILDMCRQAVEAGRTRISMKLVFEVLRWNHYIAHGDDELKLNNNFSSRFSRLIRDNHPEYAHLFVTRELKSA